MKELLRLLPVMVILMGINMALGMYYQIGKEHLKFDKQKLINGFVKATIVGLSALGLSYCFDVVDLSSIGVTPLLIIQAANITYAGKNLINFAKILGVKNIQLHK